MNPLNAAKTQIEALNRDMQNLSDRARMRKLQEIFEIRITELERKVAQLEKKKEAKTPAL